MGLGFFLWNLLRFYCAVRFSLVSVLSSVVALYFCCLPCPINILLVKRCTRDSHIINIIRNLTLRYNILFCFIHVLLILKMAFWLLIK
jgi:hypothetical protein